jgi:hypothetical protein
MTAPSGPGGVALLACRWEPIALVGSVSCAGAPEILLAGAARRDSRGGGRAGCGQAQTAAAAEDETETGPAAELRGVRRPDHEPEPRSADWAQRDHPARPPHHLLVVGSGARPLRGGCHGPDHGGSGRARQGAARRRQVGGLRQLPHEECPAGAVLRRHGAVERNGEEQGNGQVSPDLQRRRRRNRRKKGDRKRTERPQCAGQPGTEGDFATAYGSPRGNVEPTLLQMQVAAQEDTTSEFDLGRLERGFFATGH